MSEWGLEEWEWSGMEVVGVEGMRSDQEAKQRHAFMGE
jgi:hypothetical protein